MAKQTRSDLATRIMRLAGTIFLVVPALVWMPEQARSTYLVFTTEVCWPCGEDFQGTWQGKDYGTLFVAEKLEEYGSERDLLCESFVPAASHGQDGFQSESSGITGARSRIGSVSAGD